VWFLKAEHNGFHGVGWVNGGNGFEIKPPSSGTQACISRWAGRELPDWSGNWRLSFEMNYEISPRYVFDLLGSVVLADEYNRDKKLDKPPLDVCSNDQRRLVEALRRTRIPSSGAGKFNLAR
jgi:hypothetical protein